MSNKLLSFLGPTKYIKSFYSYRGKKSSRPCQFIQEAFIEFFCKHWKEGDQVIIFLTEESKKKNWLGVNENPNSNFDKGLHERLEKIRMELELNFGIKYAEIPEGRNENELWKIFEKITEVIDENSNVIFDITHSYRSLPMLALIILNYVKFVKNVKVGQIIYGALEALGSPNEVKKISLEERIIPTFNLTPFIGLFDWTLAINIFLQTGNAEMIKELGIEELKPLLTDTKGSVGGRLRNLINSLNSFSQKVLTCRGPDFRSAIKRILNTLSGAEKELENLRPFGPLINTIKNRFSTINLKNDIVCGLEVAYWCLEHDLIQQGFTILREIITNYVIGNILKIEELRQKDNREIAEDMLNSKAEEINIDILNLWHEIIDYRNDINHAGWRERNFHSPIKFKQKFKNFIEQAKNLLMVL